MKLHTGIRRKLICRFRERQPKSFTQSHFPVYRCQEIERSILLGCETALPFLCFCYSVFCLSTLSSVSCHSCALESLVSLSNEWKEATSIYFKPLKCTCNLFLYLTHKHPVMHMHVYSAYKVTRKKKNTGISLIYKKVSEVEKGRPAM